MGGCIGEAIFPAVAGIIIASFGPIGFIWYTAVASVVMVTCYVVLHISFQYKQQGSSRAIDLESVSLIPKIKEILEYVEPMSTLDRIRSRSVSVVDYRTERARSLSVVREVADKFEEYKSYGAIN